MVTQGSSVSMAIVRQRIQWLCGAVVVLVGTAWLRFTFKGNIGYDSHLNVSSKCLSSTCFFFFFSF